MTKAIRTRAKGEGVREARSQSSRTGRPSSRNFWQLNRLGAADSFKPHAGYLVGEFVHALLPMDREKDHTSRDLSIRSLAHLCEVCTAPIPTTVRVCKLIRVLDAAVVHSGAPHKAWHGHKAWYGAGALRRELRDRGMQTTG